MAKFKTRSGIVHYVSEDMKKLYISTHGSGAPIGSVWIRKRKAECLKLFGRKIYEEERRQFEAEYRYNSDQRIDPYIQELVDKDKRKDAEDEYRIKNNMPLTMDLSNHQHYNLITQELITSGVLKSGNRYYIYKSKVMRDHCYWEIAGNEERNACESPTHLKGVTACISEIMKREFEFENPDNLPMVIPEWYKPPKVKYLKPFAVQDKILDRMVNIAEQIALDNKDIPDIEDIRRIYRLLNAVKMGKEIRIIHTPQYERTAL